MPRASSLNHGPSPSARQSDDAFQRLKTEIVACRLAPGSSFSEASLSLRFGLAKAATRAALTRLAEIGLVQPVARHGYVVAPITVQSIRDLFEVRLMAEPRAASLATGRIDVMALRQRNRAPQQAETAEDQIAFVAANRAFHRLIAAATGNARLHALLEALADETERLVHLGLFGPGAGLDDRRAADDGHEALISAFAARDPAAAEAAARRHIEHAQTIVMARLVAGAIDLPIGR